MATQKHSSLTDKTQSRTPDVLVGIKKGELRVELNPNLFSSAGFQMPIAEMVVQRRGQCLLFSPNEDCLEGAIPWGPVSAASSRFNGIRKDNIPSTPIESYEVLPDIGVLVRLPDWVYDPNIKPGQLKALPPAKPKDAKLDAQLEALKKIVITGKPN